MEPNRTAYDYKTNRPYFQAKALELQKQGLGVVQISRELGVSREAARHLIDEEGYQKKLERNRIYEREKRVRMKAENLLIPKVIARIPNEVVAARLAEIPDDRRSKTGRIFGDPTFERSALFEKLKEQHTIPIRRVA
ncbi:hypothetical protein WH297_05990 [Ochrobactrum vermis]|uniref:Transposase n=1 Tax=Ochrobactrum vermis TaxID=1827297 RepID=A0ABU8PAQ2_9HYPH|nr:hypothetical protein [Ochrobactrum vermis]PQZ29779.1 hypothetical protein CQZ93_06115 [Ochrobactrum vermis]